MAVPQKKTIALQHVAFEDLGPLRPVLEARGFHVETLAAHALAERQESLMACDLLVVLGGPIGVYEAADYPFLSDELRLLRARLQAQKPTLGICLGAQLMAAALDAKVYAGKAGAEIGWSALQPAHGALPEWFQPLLAPKVLHWHGDTFDLPAGAQRLAGTENYPNQAFSLGNYALGLQFHPEVTADGLEDWYIGHTCELHKHRIDLAALRAAGRINAPLLAEPAKKFWHGWLDAVYS